MKPKDCLVIADVEWYSLKTRKLVLTVLVNETSKKQK